MTHDEIVAKFHTTAERAIATTQADRIVTLIDTLEQTADVAKLTEACS